MASRQTTTPQAPAAPAQVALRAESMRVHAGSFYGQYGIDTQTYRPRTEAVTQQRYRTSPPDDGPVNERLQSFNMVGNDAIDQQEYIRSRIDAGPERGSQALRDFHAQWGGNQR